jgi:hypothetical protein
MNRYFDGLSRAFESKDFILLTYAAIGVFMATLLLILASRVIKYYVNRRVHKIGTFSLTFEDIEKMRQTGLITELEYSRIKSGIIRHLMGTTETDIPKDTVKSQDIPEIPTTPPTGAPLARPSGPVDIDDLLKKGLISEEEYQAIYKISRRNPPKK